MSSAMPADTVLDCAEDAVTRQTDDGVSTVKQELEEVNDRLITLSERITLCNRVMTDLKDLRKVLTRKSLQDAPLPSHK